MRISLPNSAKRCFIGLWLATLYFFCVTIVVFSLSACLFQEKLAHLSKKSREASSFIDNYCNSEAIKNNSDLDPIIKVLCLPVISPVEKKLITSADIFVRYNEWKGFNVEAGVNFKVEQRLLVKLKELEAKLKDPKIPHEIKEDLEKEKKFLEGDRDTVANKRKILRDITLANQTDGQLADIFVQIYHFEKFFSHISSYMGAVADVDNYWLYPEYILNINLILSMGILGSLIFLTIEFIKEPRGYLNKSYNMYFLRPFLGMIIALAIYVMVKSGQLLLFSSDNSELSPYMISFLGIISGMLSEQAYKKISSTGTQFFSEAGDDNKDIIKNQGGM